jgi:DNA-binding IclR family transcriptional regulator
VLSAPEEPLATTVAVATRRNQLDAQLDEVRRDGLARDDGELHPQMGCIAVPWPQPGLPGALACMGSPSEVSAAEAVITTALSTAAADGSQPQDVVASIARVLGAKQADPN